MLLFLFAVFSLLFPGTLLSQLGKQDDVVLQGDGSSGRLRPCTVSYPISGVAWEFRVRLPSLSLHLTRVHRGVLVLCRDLANSK